ncbi:MAG: transposase [Candidatus Saccharimonadales bacterium]
MSSKNREKIYLEDCYYHIYNRGVAKQVIFHDKQDYAVFLNLLKRYLDREPARDNKGREYDWLHPILELLAFCLMPNHFHLLVYQVEPEAMTRLLRGVATSYTKHYNKRYRRVGPLFQDRFKASMITSDEYLEHVSRYIHLNPRDYMQWEYSSLPYYLGAKQAAWVSPQKILDQFKETHSDYLEFVNDYKDTHDALEKIKHELADY